MTSESSRYPAIGCFRAGAETRRHERKENGKALKKLLGRADESKEWMAKYDEIKVKINTLYWDETDGFYYDILKPNRAKVKVMTPASFWPVLAEMSSGVQIERMASRLTEDKTLGGALPTVSLSRSDADFRADGGYWRGAMWLPTKRRASSG